MSEQNLSENRHFGRYLRRIREDRKLSLDAVEEMTVGYPEPVTKSHLSRIENGRAVPTFPRMFALCQIYGVPISSMAERFETDLRRPDRTLDAFDRKDPASFIERLKSDRAEGRYDAVLWLTTIAIDQLRGRSDEPSIELRQRFSVWRVGAMIKLAHYELGKLRCEELLTEAPRTSEFHLRALVAFVICAYRLGRLAVALMGLTQMERLLEEQEWPADLRAIAHSTRGSVYYGAKDLENSRAGFEQAFVFYDEIGNDTERCRARINLAQVLIDRNQFRAAERHLTSCIEESTKKGFRRQLAVAYGHYAVLSYKTERFESAERCALKSNTFAREFNHQPIIFRNCYYLWKLAVMQGDPKAMASNERNLRSLVDRVPQDLDEVELYRQERGNR